MSTRHDEASEKAATAFLQKNNGLNGLAAALDAYRDSIAVRPVVTDEMRNALTDAYMNTSGTIAERSVRDAMCNAVINYVYPHVPADDVAALRAELEKAQRQCEESDALAKTLQASLRSRIFAANAEIARLRAERVPMRTPEELARGAVLIFARYPRGHDQSMAEALRWAFREAFPQATSEPAVAPSVPADSAWQPQDAEPIARPDLATLAERAADAQRAWADAISAFAAERRSAKI